MSGDDINNASVTIIDDEEIEQLDDMKKRLKEMEDEVAALREMQAKVEKEMSSAQDPAAASTSQENREEVDARSVFVGNALDLAYCSPSDLHGFGIPGTDLFLAQVTNAFVISLDSHEAIRNGQIALNGIQRRIMKVSIGDAIPMTRLLKLHDG